MLFLRRMEAKYMIYLINQWFTQLLSRAGFSRPSPLPWVTMAQRTPRRGSH